MVEFVSLMEEDSLTLPDGETDAFFLENVLVIFFDGVSDVCVLVLDGSSVAVRVSVPESESSEDGVRDDGVGLPRVSVPVAVSSEERDKVPPVELCEKTSPWEGVRVIDNVSGSFVTE